MLCSHQTILLGREITCHVPLMNAPFQSLFPEPLSIQSHSVQFLRALWEKTQAGGAHSFETAMMESTFPEQKVNASFLKRVIFSQDSRRVCFFLVVQCFLFFPFLSFVIIRRLTCHAIAGSGPSDISRQSTCLLRLPDWHNTAHSEPHRDGKHFTDRQL